jgi:hypothetical protein
MKHATEWLLPKLTSYQRGNKETPSSMLHATSMNVRETTRNKIKCRPLVASFVDADLVSMIMIHCYITIASIKYVS